MTRMTSGPEGVHPGLHRFVVHSHHLYEYVKTGGGHGGERAHH